MSLHTWTNRMVPPLVVTAVVACVWLALAQRPQATPTAPAAQAASPQAASVRQPENTVASAAVIPSVQKQGDDLHISINPAPYKQVQKVEFYVESRFVGTAYTQPYSVVVSQNTLTAGEHSVVAKIYAAKLTAQSQPAVFTAQPKSTPAPSADEDVATVTTKPPVTTPPTQPAAPIAPSIGTPANLTVSEFDTTSASLSWDAVANATGYQVWRDGALLATVPTTAYTDTGLAPSTTYDYQVAALDASGNVSALSTALPVTTAPLPEDTGPVNGGGAGGDAQPKAVAQDPAGDTEASNP